VFTWPSLGNETLAVSNKAPRGHVLATLRARDRDIGVNANLTYHLSVTGSGHWGSEDDWARRPTFIVIPETGALLVAADLGTYLIILFGALCRKDHVLTKFLADRTAAHSMNVYWHDSVVCLSVCDAVLCG